MSGHKTTHTQMERYKIIDSILSSGQVVSFTIILKTLQTQVRDAGLSESSVRRDFRYMKEELAAPLAYDKKLHGWKYTKSYKLPSEHFSDDEKLCLHLIRKLLAQHSPKDELYTAFDKLLEKLSPSVIDDSLFERFYIPPRPKMKIDTGTCEKILYALKSNCMVDFTYYSKWEPQEKHRKIMPYQLVLDEGSLYLYGASYKDKNNPRLFNLSKIHNLQILHSTNFTLPENFRFREDFEKGRFGAFQYDDYFDFKIAFYGDARSSLHEYVWADNQSVQEIPNKNTSIISFESSQWIPILKWILSFGPDAKPLEPDWFVDMWKKSVTKMAKRAK